MHRETGSHTAMIQALKREDVVDRAGGRFRFCALVQKRLQELLEGARPLVERNTRSDLEIAIEEVAQGLIAPASSEELAAAAALEQPASEDEAALAS